MSQSLWSKLLNGGLSNIEPLDPLRVPIVKVDQSQGRTSYRMILTNIEIRGLNDSSLESIHIGRGSVKSNLSEHEAGYVSYNDRNAIDFIRYRFHTVVKETNNNQSTHEDLKVLPLETNENENGNSRSNYGNSETRRESYKYQENNQRYTSDDYSNRRYANTQPQENQNQYNQRSQQHHQQQHHQTQDQQQHHYQQPQQHQSNPQHQQHQQNQQNQQHNHQPQYPQQTNQPNYQQHQHNHQQHQPQYPQQSQQPHQQHENNPQQHEHQQHQYPQQHQQQYPQQHQQHQNQHRGGQDNISPNYKESFGMSDNQQRPFKQNINSENNYQRHHQIPQIEGFKSTAGYSTIRNSNNKNNDGNNDDTSRYLIYAQTQKNNDNRGNKYESGGSLRGNFGQITGRNDNVDISRNINGQRMNGNVQIKYPVGLNGNNKPCADLDDVEMLNQKDFGINGNKNRGTFAKLENQPGYVDIIYADENSNKMRHFGNLRIESRGDKTVYSLDDIIRDLENHRRFIIHNFTESESLLKRNDKLRTAEETKRIKDMVRYAKEFQEKQGYFEEGMELIYHYGNGSETKVYDGKRMKRAHELENENEDDIMHVVIKIHVPVLRVKAGYVLTGKVKDQVLRGNGQLIGNFTELIGEFTIELKKSNDNKTLTVRAARAKLEAKNQNIKLQGMDENDAVAEILTQGLTAAEAVAAMLADDLATKALSESTADAMIYRMYKELPKN
ncbi:hypothetical protein PV325_009779 [Microctonus aethiopoides]|nr:hypothetical protein PV325_009779 [Microctonus aethiopoides]